jgi:signal recognition particle subunit SRP54
VEKAQEEIDLADAAKMQEKMLTAKFDFSDFLKQMRLLKNMGSLGGLMKLIPGMGKLSADQLQQGETKLKQSEAMINSMTTEERRNPDLLASSPSRRRRIARGSGYQERDVANLVSEFTKMRSLMQQMGQGQMPGMPGMGEMGGMLGGMGGNPAQAGWRGYPGGGAQKKKKKEKKKKGFGQL